MIQQEQKPHYSKISQSPSCARGSKASSQFQCLAPRFHGDDEITASMILAIVNAELILQLAKHLFDSHLFDSDPN